MTEPQPPERFFPPPPPLAPKPKPGLFRRTPPAIFPAILGALMLGLGWRQGGWLIGLPDGPAEMFLGAATLLWLFATVAYAAKLVRRPMVIDEDFEFLPGQLGIATLLMSFYTMAMVIAPYAPRAGRLVLEGGLLLHIALIVRVIRALAAKGPDKREVTPVWQFIFAGPLLGAVASQMLGLEQLALVTFCVTLPVVAVVGGFGLWQLWQGPPPEPLRPLLATHLTPVCLLGLVAIGFDWQQGAFVFAALAATILMALIARPRWLLVSGYTPLWAVFSISLAAFARFTLGLLPTVPVGTAILVPATLVVLWNLALTIRDWIKGTLAEHTQAAEA